MKRDEEDEVNISYAIKKSVLAVRALVSSLFMTFSLPL